METLQAWEARMRDRYGSFGSSRIPQDRVDIWFLRFLAIGSILSVGLNLANAVLVIDRAPQMGWALLALVFLAFGLYSFELSLEWPRYQRQRRKERAA
jgi:hypothetical protein